MDKPPPTRTSPKRVPAEAGAFEKYRPIAELGRGGMGDVYLAVAAGPGGFSKLLVLKQLRSSDDPNLVAMFLEEARLSARVNHPNVVQTYEIVHEPENQRAFMVMEFLDGPSLSKLRRSALARGKPVPLAFELFILREALTGLHAVHELRSYGGEPLHVVHRDFTPTNLLVTYGGEVKIADFGIAKALDQQEHTAAGVFKGKLTYVPPEQLLGQPVDRRADLFAGGVMLFEAVTGHSPWKGMTNATVTHALAGGRIPRLMEYPGAPPELAAICDQALAVDPDSRYGTALEFRDAIDEVVAEHHLEADHLQLGAYVSTVLAGAKLRTRKIIEEQMRAPGTAALRQSLPLLDGLTPSPTEKVQGRDLQSLMASSEMPDTGARARERLGPTTIALLGLFGGLLVVLVALVAWLVVRLAPGPAPVVVETGTPEPAVRALPRPAPVEPPPASPVPPAERAVAPRRVTVRIRTSPAQARVVLDDQVMPNPFEGTFLADRATHRLWVSAPGHEELRRTLELDHDLDLDVTISPRARTPRALPAPPPTPLVQTPPAQDEAADPDYFPPRAPTVPRRPLDENIEF